MLLRHISLNSNQCKSNKTFEVSSRQMYPFSIFLLAFPPSLLCTLHPCLQISRPVKCLCTKFVTNRRQHSVLHHLSTSTCNIIPKDICKYCIHSSDFLLPENRPSGKLRWTNHFRLRKFNNWTLIKLEEGGRRAIMMRLWGSSSQASLVFSKCGQEDLDYDDDIQEQLQVFTKIYKAHLFILRLEICKEAKKSSWMKIMMLKKSNCSFLPKSAQPIFSSSAQRTKSDHLQGTPIPLQDFYISFFLWGPFTFLI